MKAKITSVFITAVMLLTVLTLVSACAKAKAKPVKISGSERGKVASNTMELVENDIRQLVLQINIMSCFVNTVFRTV